MTPRALSALLDPAETGSRRLAENAAYDRLVGIVDKVPHGKIKSTGIDEFVTVVAEIYNGGVSGLADNALSDVSKALMALHFVSADCQQASALHALIRAAYPSMQRYSEAMASGDEESYDDDLRELQSAADPLEDFVYNEANMDPIFRAMYRRLRGPDLPLP
jgi:hypothetical protein